MASMNVALGDDRRLRIALVRQVTNVPALKAKDLAGVAFLDASKVLSTFQVMAAAANACNREVRGALKTRNVHSEIVVVMSPVRNISEALRMMTPQEGPSCDVVVAAIDMAEGDWLALLKSVEGQLADAGEIDRWDASAARELSEGSPVAVAAETSAVAGAAREQRRRELQEVYRIEPGELKAGSLEHAVVTRLAVKDLM